MCVCVSVSVWLCVAEESNLRRCSDCTITENVYIDQSCANIKCALGMWVVGECRED